MSVKDFLFGSSLEARPLADFGLMLLRGFAGFGLALGHGLGKLQAPDRFLGMVPNLPNFAEYGISLPSAVGWVAIFTEVVGGVLLALGLLTRPAALLILCLMLVAFFGVHFGRDPYTRMEPALLYGFIAIAFLIIGSGRYGFDALLRGGRGAYRGR